MLMRIIKVLIGIILLPVIAALSISFAAELARIGQLEGSSGYFLKGVVFYLIMHLVLYKPNYFYVIGHEVAHALASFICGGRVGTMRVSPGGGSVLTTKSNFFIALFPYFFPTYTILFWLIFLFFSVFREVTSFVPHFLFLVGFSLTLHLVMTIDSLKVRQSDILKTGYIFSVSLIYMLNILLVSLILSAVFKDFSFSAFFHSSVAHAAKIYYAIYGYLFL